MKLHTAALASIAGLATAANAADLLIVDLTVPNEITITATAAASAVTATGSDGIGVYLDGFYGADRTSTISDILVSGDLRSFLNPGNNNPNLFTAFNNDDPGLNIFAWSPDTSVSFTAGTQAFIGSATWTVPAADYADLLTANMSGDIYFPADDDGDLATAQVIGQWRLIPAPSAMALLGLGGLAAARRRRA